MSMSSSTTTTYLMKVGRSRAPAATSAADWRAPETLADGHDRHEGGSPAARPQPLRESRTSRGVPRIRRQQGYPGIRPDRRLERGDAENDRVVPVINSVDLTTGWGCGPDA